MLSDKITKENLRKRHFDEFNNFKNKYESAVSSSKTIANNKVVNCLVHLHIKVINQLASILNMSKEELTLNHIKDFDKPLYSYWSEIREQLFHINDENLSINQALNNIQKKIDLLKMSESIAE